MTTPKKKREPSPVSLAMKAHRVYLTQVARVHTLEARKIAVGADFDLKIAAARKVLPGLLKTANQTLAQIGARPLDGSPEAEQPR